MTTYTPEESADVSSKAHAIYEADIRSTRVRKCEWHDA